MIRTSEKRKEEKKGLASQIAYKDLFDLNPQPMWVYDIETLRILDVNDAAIRHYGYRREEFLRLSPADLCGDQESITSISPGKGCPGQFSFSKDFVKHRKKGGKVIDVLVQSSVICINGRNAELIVATDVTAVRAVEEERKAINEKLTDAQKIAKLGYWKRGMDEDLSEWSPEMYEIYGRDPETFQPTFENLIACFHPDDRYLLSQETFNKLGKEGHTDFEHRIITSDGEIKWVFQRLEFEKDKNGNRVALKGIIQDITEKHEASERLSEREHRFKVLVQEGADLIAIMDFSGNYLFASESSWPMLGIHCEDFIGQSVFDFVHPDDSLALGSMFEKLSKNKRIVSPPFRFRDATGNYRWMRTIATNMTDDPAVKGIVTNSRDITETILKAQALEVSNERYKLILKAANEAIYDWDLEKNVIEWGSGFREIFGYDLSEKDNGLWTDHIFEEDKARVKCEMERARYNPEKELLVYECRYVRANGEVAEVEHRVIFVRNREGQAIRAVGAVKDITDYKQNLLKIKLQNDRLKEIAWAQSHMVRAPLARMMGLIELFNMGECGTMSQEQILEHIRSSAKELDQIIKDIVSKAKPSWVVN